MHYAIGAVSRAVSRIGALFTSRKISAPTASSSLTKLGVPSGTVNDLISDWAVTAAANVKALTEWQIVDAWRYGAMSQDEAINDLGAVGATQDDGWVLL